jgi:hypothetical protein
MPGSYMYTETLGRWHTVDLFVGLAYLSHRASPEYAASDIAACGQPISCDLPMTEGVALLVREGVTWRRGV